MSNWSLQKVEHYYNLFMFYHLLLTNKQKQYFNNYFNENLSLQEIAAIYQVSRTAVYDSLVKVMKILDDYELKLQLFAKYQARKKVYDNYQDFDFIKKLQEIDNLS